MLIMLSSGFVPLYDCLSSMITLFPSLLVKVLLAPSEIGSHCLPFMKTFTVVLCCEFYLSVFDI